MRNWEMRAREGKDDMATGSEGGRVNVCIFLLDELSCAFPGLLVGT